MPSVTLALIGARLRAARGRPAAVVAALAVASVIPILVSVSAAVTADAALGRDLAGLPVGDRSAIVSYNEFLTDGEARSADALARRELSALVDGPVRRQVEFRQLADSTGRTFVLAGTDDLASAVRITSGRAPRSCTPARCEVVLMTAGGAAPVPVLRSGYGLVVVGQAVRTDPLLLSGTFAPVGQEPVLLGDGVDAVADNSPLALIQRSYAWVAPLDRRLIIKRGVPAWTSTATDVANRLQLALPGMDLATPDQSIGAQAARAQASARRFGLLAGGCAVLLLGSAVIGGAALRPDEMRFVAALRRRGLSPGRIQTVVAAEALALVVAAALVGLLAGAGLAAVLVSRAGLPVVSSTLAALGTALPAVLALSLGAFALLTLTLWPRSGVAEQGSERAAWRALTGVAFGCLLALLLLISRGAVSSSTVSDSTGDPLLIVLPALVLLTVGLATARTWPWVIRLGYRVLPRSAVGSRLGIAGIAARPLLAAATVALLAAAVGATGFAASYRSTLGRGAADQAAFEVPMTARLTPGDGLRPVLMVASVADYQRLAPGLRVVPVVRQAGSIQAGAQQAEVIQAVGLAPSALARLRRWPTVVAGPDPGAVGRAIATAVPGSGLRLPAGRLLRLRVDGDAAAVAVTAWLRAVDGREQSVALTATPVGRTATNQSWTLTGALPAMSIEAADWSLTALTFSQPTDQATHRQHALGEGDTGRAVPSGRLGFGPIMVDDAAQPHPWSGWNGTGLAVAAAGSNAVLNYRLLASTLVINAATAGPGVAQSGTPLRVAADPVTAAAGPLITLTLNRVPVEARVVATLPRFPTVSGRFVIADGNALSSLLDRSAPGTGQAGELWLDLPGSGSAASTALAQARNGLTRAPFAHLGSEWSADVEHGLRTDPVAQGAAGLLLLAAVLTMLVALAALVLLVVGERSEDAAELYTWEANGVRPGVLRRALWVRAALVAVVAVPAGVLGGLVLTRLTARLVNVTAGAGIAQPPLVAVTGLGTELPAVLIALVVALAVAGLVAAAAFREPLPVLDPAAAKALR